MGVRHTAVESVLNVLKNARCVAVYCMVVQCVAVCCEDLLQCVFRSSEHIAAVPSCMQPQCVAAYCSVLQRVVVRYSVLQCVAVCCSVLQCVAVCCVDSVTLCRSLFASVGLLLQIRSNGITSTLQCVAVCCSVLQLLQCSAVCNVFCSV